ncbi:MAG TPA: sodium:proton antiporter [Rhodopila sp.]|nr:sodium:proton antiporter [Rhodopila sp.]
MALFELIIALLLAGAILAAFSRRIGVPYPALLALAGTVAAFLPGTPTVTLEPQLALTLFVAPVLLDAAYDASLRDIRNNWLPIGTLAVIVVILTVIGVAAVARVLVPAMPWPAALALGAIVAPPDASAATAVLRQLRPPHRLLVILQGESLLNDATALLIYQSAVGAAVGSIAFGWTALPMLLLTAGGGAVLGYLLARLWALLPAHSTEVPIDVLIQFISTFAVWLIADHLGISAIITVVVYAMTIARTSPSRMRARRRIASFAVWDVAVFVLNVLAFILIGLQLKTILARLDGGLGLYAGVAAAVCAAVIAIRIGWVMTSNAFVRWIHRHGGDGKLVPPTVQGGVVVAWCGMRGIVTLATALALPQGFPYRDLIVFCAFWVVLGTLAVQGLTLRPLMQHLTLPEDTSVEREVQLARRETARAAVRMLRDTAYAGEESEALRLLYREYAARAAGGAEAPSHGRTLAGLQGRAVAVQRQTLFRLRHEGTIGDDAYHVIEEELDIIELTADHRVRTLDVPE